MADQSTTSRNILIVGALLGLAAAGMGVHTMLNSQARQVDNHIGTKPAQVEELVAAAEQVQANVRRDLSLADVAPEGALANGQPRIIPFFYSTELWQVPPQGGGTLHDVVDIYDPTVAAIHEGIPNEWFLKHGLVSALSNSEGAAQDSDKDGFSNREEFEAATDPSKAESLPPLVQATAGKPAKLEVVKIERAHAVITVDSIFALGTPPEEAGIRILSRVGDSRPILKVPVKVGGSFGLGGKDDAKRFTLVAFEKKEFADSMGGKSIENVIRVRDNDALTEANREFIVRAGSPKVNDKDRNTPNAKGYEINDTAARIRVTAGPLAGQPSGTIRVPLHATFKVPGDEKISCRLESVDANGSVNILPEGAQSPINIPAAKS